MVASWTVAVNMLFMLIYVDFQIIGKSLMQSSGLGPLAWMIKKSDFFRGQQVEIVLKGLIRYCLIF